MITIRDVAKECGYSPTTVCAVLNNAPLARHIPDTTKSHVRRAAERLGYHPDPFARALRSQRSQTIGVMVPDVTDPYCSQILRGIATKLKKSGFLWFLTDIQNSRVLFRRYLDSLLERRVEGLITLANSLYFETDLLEAFEKRRIPCVILGRQLEGSLMNWVATDNEVGAHMALRHLRELGHRRIAFIRGPKMIVDSARQWKGICSFMQKARLALDPQLVLTLTSPFSSYEGGYALTKELLLRKRAFTALLAFDDMAAFGAIRALVSAGIRVPEDCSVVGFDDIPAAAFYNPALTTVREGMERLGSMGAEILVEAVRAVRSNGKPLGPVHRQVRPQLVIRQSTTKARER